MQQTSLFYVYVIGEVNRNQPVRVGTACTYHTKRDTSQIKRSTETFCLISVSQCCSISNTLKVPYLQNHKDSNQHSNLLQIVSRAHVVIWTEMCFSDASVNMSIRTAAGGEL